MTSTRKRRPTRPRTAPADGNLSSLARTTFAPLTDRAEIAADRPKMIERAHHELPVIELAMVLLADDDQQLEARVRGMGDEGQTFMAFADGIHAIGERHKALLEICEAVHGRLLVVLARLAQDPAPPARASEGV